MPFTARDVKDRVVQYPHRYQFVEVSTGIYDLVPVTGTVTEAGTAINKAYLQPIEDGLNALGSIADYGRVKIKNDLNTSAYADGEALSAYQGNILNDKIVAPKDALKYSGTIVNGSAETTLFTFDVTKYSHISWNIASTGGAVLDIWKDGTSYVIGGIQVSARDYVYTNMLTIGATSAQIIAHYGVRNYLKISISGTTCTISSVGAATSASTYIIYLS